MDVYLSHWFTSSAEARRHLEMNGGFLFPYERHFFVTEAPAVRHLALDPDDPDWETIGHDWVEPADPEAWERLSVKRWTTA